MQDPISDMLTRIRNAQRVRKKSVAIPVAKLKVEIAKVLAAEGYIESFSTEAEKPVSQLVLLLKYYGANLPVIRRIDSISKPSLRVYKKARDIPSQISGFGIIVISTPQGVMTGRQARAKNVGGELLCCVA